MILFWGVPIENTCEISGGFKNSNFVTLTILERVVGLLSNGIGTLSDNCVREVTLPFFPKPNKQTNQKTDHPCSTNADSLTSVINDGTEIPRSISMKFIPFDRSFVDMVGEISIADNVPSDNCLAS